MTVEVVKTGDVSVLFVKVSEPANVARVPVVGRVTFVVPVSVLVKAKLPEPATVIAALFAIPVPPCAADNGVVNPLRLVMFELAPDVAYPEAGKYVATHAEPVYTRISLEVLLKYISPAVIAAPRGSSVGSALSEP